MIEVAEALRAEVEQAAERLAALSEADVTASREPAKWTRKEILGHLIDSAVNNHERFVRAQFADPFTWPDYDQDAWVAVHRYRERPWHELVEIFVAVNRQVAAVIEGLPPERRGTECHIGQAEAVSLEWCMRDYLRHLGHHLEQIGAGSRVA